MTFAVWHQQNYPTAFLRFLGSAVTFFAAQQVFFVIFTEPYAYFLRGKTGLLGLRLSKSATSKKISGFVKQSVKVGQLRQ